MSIIFNQTYTSLTNILDGLLDDLTLSKAKQRALIKDSLRPHKEKHFTTAEICKEFQNAFSDYHLLRDIFLSTYARDVREDHRGVIDDRKFHISIVKIAKREGISGLPP